ncbi:MAG: hypothetical protein ABIS07_07570, partial [Dokdonella sp.]
QANSAVDALAAMKPANPEQLANALLAQARIALAQHDNEAGCAAANQALELRPLDDPKSGWRHAEAQAVHAECLAARREFMLARSELQAALASLQRARGTHHWMTQSVLQMLQSLPKA